MRRWETSQSKGWSEGKVRVAETHRSSMKKNTEGKERLETQSIYFSP